MHCLDSIHVFTRTHTHTASPLPPHIPPGRRSIGYYDQAYKLMSDLKTLIDAHESAVGRDYEARLSAQHEARQQLDELLRRQAQAEQEDKDGSEVSQNESTKRD